MNVVVQNLDGSKIYPSYAPEHKDSVVAFYNDLLETQKAIAGFTIRFDNGDFLAEGQVL